jgi:xanthine dehydrogenase accessory factor
VKQIVQEMEKLSFQGELFELATLITHDGLAPRSTGAKTLINQDGSTIGDLGGGILEAQVQQLAVEMIKKTPGLRLGV